MFSMSSTHLWPRTSSSSRTIPRSEMHSRSRALLPRIQSALTQRPTTPMTPTVLVEETPSRGRRRLSSRTSSARAQALGRTVVSTGLPRRTIASMAARIAGRSPSARQEACAGTATAGTTHGHLPLRQRAAIRPRLGSDRRSSTMTRPHSARRESTRLVLRDATRAVRPTLLARLDHQRLGLGATSNGASAWTARGACSGPFRLVFSFQRSMLERVCRLTIASLT